MPSTNDRLAASGAARDEIEAVRKMLRNGEYYQAIPRLQHTLSKYPETRAAEEGRYLLGLTYYEIGDYRDAIDMLNQYLEVAPTGEHAAESRELVASLSEEYQRRFPTVEEITDEIESVRTQIEQRQDSVELKRQLANLLWKRGNYEEAGKLYIAIAKVNPGFKQTDTFQQRIDLLSDGDYVVLSPGELRRREIAKDPLGVINVNSFRSGRDLFTSVPRYYVVSGQVVNRSDSVLYGVQVQVTIYGFGNVVYDTNTFHVGRLNGGEIRAFTVRFNDFPNINRIDRYEAIGTFER